MSDEPQSGRAAMVILERERFEQKMAKLREMWEKRGFDVTTNMVLDGLALLLSLELYFRTQPSMLVDKREHGYAAATPPSSFSDGFVHAQGQTPCEAIINLAKEIRDE